MGQPASMLLDQIPWTRIQPEDMYIYPFGSSCNIASEFYDEVKRSPSCVLASLAQFAKLIETEDITLERIRFEGNPVVPPKKTEVQRLARFCSDTMIQQDLDEFGNQFGNYDTAQRVTIPPNQLPEADAQELPQSLPDLTEYKEVIFYDDIQQQQNKWVVFLAIVLPRNANNEIQIDVHGFFIGGATVFETTTFQKRVHRALALSYTTSTISWYERLHVPTIFASDNVFMTFLLIRYLHRHGNYLDLTLGKIMMHKFDSKAMLKFLKHHDLWLGKLDFDEITDSSHPFVA